MIVSRKPAIGACRMHKKLIVKHTGAMGFAELRTYSRVDPGGKSNG